MSAKRARFAIALVVAAGLMALLVALSLRGSLEHFVGPSQLVANGERYALNGTIVKGYAADPAARADSPEGLRFLVADKTDRTKQTPVVYRGLVPDTFQPGIEVVVKGTYGTDGVFVAEHDALTTLCPSKFQSARDQGKRHPANTPIDAPEPVA